MAVTSSTWKWCAARCSTRSATTTHMLDAGYAWPVIDMQLRYVRGAKFGQRINVRASLVEWENRLKVNYLITDLAAFSDFVLNNVTVIMTQFPASMDLNKVFELINNRGQQLQHHEILKSRLLQHIRNAAERERYAALWEACAYMDDYVERNLRRVTRLDVHALFTTAAASRIHEAMLCIPQRRRRG